MDVLRALVELIRWPQAQAEREVQFADKTAADWRESFTGTIDEFKARDAA